MAAEGLTKRTAADEHRKEDFFFDDDQHSQTKLLRQANPALLERLRAIPPDKRFKRKPDLRTWRDFVAAVNEGRLFEERRQDSRSQHRHRDESFRT
eukprot:m.122691 g.122691  ORF g.122691 m.122691 type:complete len:96 (-) comp52132_c1_seq2:64-351(-)